MEPSELAKKLAENSGSIEETRNIVNDVIIQDDVPQLVAAIPQKTFEDLFTSELFSNLISHSDPELNALGSFIPKGSESFRAQVQESVLKYLRSCYKDGELSKGAVALTPMVKLLGTATTLSDSDCERILQVILLYSANTLGTTISSSVVIAMAKCIELSPDKASNTIKNVMGDLLLEDTRDTLITAFSLLGNLFHVSSTIGQFVFSMDEIQQQQFNKNHLVSENVVLAALEALSAACVDKQSRALVTSNFGPVIDGALQSDKQAVALIAASILVKTKGSAESKEDQTDELASLSEYFETAIIEKVNDRYVGPALEGLAYTSLLLPVKRRIVDRRQLLKNLVDVLENHTRQSSWVYCVLCILANVTEYSKKLSPEQSKMRDLKNYAGKSQLDSKNQEDDQTVTARNKKIFDLKVTATISKNCPRFSPSSRKIAGVLLRNLVTEKSHRAEFTKQGGLAVLVYLLIPHDNVPDLDAHYTSIATSALAKTLISMDPGLAFGTKISPVVTIKPLAAQLSAESSDGTLLDTFEALLALTNLAAVDETSRHAIVRDAFARVEILLTSSNALVQRASIELICNLAMSPHCAEKFLDGSGPANSRLDIIAVLTDVDDRAARHAAAGALAVLSEWGPAPAIMSKRDKLMAKLLEVVNTEDQEMVIRGVVTLRNLVLGGAAEAVKARGGVAALRAVAQQWSNDQDIASTALETIKALIPV